MMNKTTRPSRALLRRLLLPAVLVLVGAPFAAPAGTMAASGPCSLPLTHDRYDGFHIGVPAGWGLSTFNDTIAVTRDPSAAEMAVVYPALLTNGLTPASFYAAYSRVLEQYAATDHNQLSFHLTSTAGQLPQAVVTGRAGNVQVAGRATVTVLHYATALAASEVVFSAYWAPTTRLAADSTLLAGIGRCYGPEAGTIYQVVQDQVFAFALPQGWKVSDEGQDNVDIVGDGGHADASYLLTLLPTSEAGATPRSLLNAVFGRLHIQVTRFISSSNTPLQQNASGGMSGEEVDEFTGQFAGKAVHGLVYVTSSAGGSVTSGVLRLGLADATAWNGVNSGLIKVMTSIQHSTGQDAAQWQHLTSQWQQFSQTTQQFDDVLNGVQEVQDPTTGQVYAAPYDTYETNGPDGAGYYLQKGGFQQRLQEVSN
jgi:hypothetical protein